MSDQNVLTDFSGALRAGEDVLDVPGRRRTVTAAPDDVRAEQQLCPTDVVCTAAATVTEEKRIVEWQVTEANRRLQLLQAFWKLLDEGVSRAKAAKRVGVPYVSLWRWEKEVKFVEAAGTAATDEQILDALMPKTDECGRKPEYLPDAGELAVVNAIYIRLNDSRVRGRGLGSSKVTAFRLAAKSEDPRIGEMFRGVVLKRKSKTVPPSWLRLLDVPAAVLDVSRDRSSLMRSHISTPRGMTYINAAGQELPLRAGSIFESDDGTVNFPVWIPWPYGGDKCSDKFGVKTGRFQLLPIVDRRSRMCVAWHFVIRAKSSYRGEDCVAVFGDCFYDIGMPEALCLERGSWESELVSAALRMINLPVIRAWEPKQKNAVENFFDRLWTPLSLLPGDVGRRRGENKENTDLVLQCEAGRRDPREHFLAVGTAATGMANAVAFVNSEPVESSTGWGRWVPEQLFMDQTEGCGKLRRLPSQMRIFFSREQREWTVRGNVVGGPVNTPMLSFPVYFQCEEIWEFEGCRLKAFFDPFSDNVKATLVLMEDEWRSYKRGHVIARDVPALERPPQAVLAADWSRSDELERGLAIRKAMAKAVRTEYWNFRGGRRSEARDGFGNSAVRTDAPREGTRPTETGLGQTTRTVVQQIRGVDARPRISLGAPSREESARQADRLRREAEAARLVATDEHR